MPVRPIVMLGSDVLRQRAEEVPVVDAEVRELIDDMFATMYDAEGVGLAAPQVGVLRRVIVVDVKEDGVEPFAMVNPTVVEETPELARAEEGCLSIPGLAAAVERAASVVVEGLDRDGAPLRVAGSGLLGRCLQHEIDHLNGVLFIDRLSALKRKMLLSKWKKRQD